MGFGGRAREGGTPPARGRLREHGLPAPVRPRGRAGAAVLPALGPAGLRLPAAPARDAPARPRLLEQKTCPLPRSGAGISPRPRGEKRGRAEAAGKAALAGGAPPRPAFPRRPAAPPRRQPAGAVCPRPEAGEWEGGSGLAGTGDGAVTTRVPEGKPPRPGGALEPGWGAYPARSPGGLCRRSAGWRSEPSLRGHADEGGATPCAAPGPPPPGAGGAATAPSFPIGCWGGAHVPEPCARRRRLGAGGKGRGGVCK